MRPFECLEQMVPGMKIRCIYRGHVQQGQEAVVVRIVPLLEHTGMRGRIHLRWNRGGEDYWWEPGSFAPTQPLSPEEEVIWQQRLEESKRQKEELRLQAEDLKRREAWALKFL